PLRAQPAALRVVEVAQAVLEATARDRTARLRRIAIRAEERLAARAARIAPLAPLAARRAQLLRRAWRRAGGRRLDRAHGPAAGEVVAAGIAAGRQGGGGGGWGRRARGGRAGTAGEGPADGAHAQALVRARAVGGAGVAAAGGAVVAGGVLRARGRGGQGSGGGGGRPAAG